MVSISCPIHDTWPEVLIVKLYNPYQIYHIAWKWNWTQTLTESVFRADFLSWVTGETEPYIGILGNRAIVFTKPLLYNANYNIFYNAHFVKKRKTGLICIFFVGIHHSLLVLEMLLLSILARFAYRRSDPALLHHTELKNVSQTANGDVI